MNPAEHHLSANLDLLRAIAVVLVLAQHLARRSYVETFAWMPTSSWGLFGVLLFFVHTCLVLMYSMERSHLTGSALFRNFVIRRVFRIYPLSIVAVLTALALHLDTDINGIRGLSHGHFPGLVTASSNLLLIQNLTDVKSIPNVLWSLPFELQMYAFLPFLFLWIGRNSFRSQRMAWPLLALWIVSVGVALAQPHIPHIGRLSILLFLPNFLAGVIAYALPHRPRIASSLWPVFILVLAVAFAIRPVFSTGWFLCLVLGSMIPKFREIQSPWLRWISHRIATYSYGIYLSHQFAIWAAFGVLAAHSLAVKIPVLVAMLVALPILLYRSIEKPMIGVGVRLARRFTDQHENAPDSLLQSAF
ncbi:MAG: acyltransferase [Terriglobales bacterium]|jgi:peptidoglycan/LPS O-acetylase OafA/YrhL